MGGLLAKESKNLGKDKDEERQISRIVNFQRVSKCMLCYASLSSNIPSEE
jgi:hypothetical protein